MSAVAFARRLDRFISAIGMIGGWLTLLLVAVVCFDVVTRRMFVFYSTFFQELEWHIHTVVFTLALGFAYLRGAHVRIDLVRDRLSPRARARLELVGIVVFLVPFAVLITWFGIDFTRQAFLQHESSTSAQGIPHRWIIKSFIPIGMILLLLAALATAIRAWFFLAGRAPAPEAFESEGIPVVADTSIPDGRGKLPEVRT